MDSVDKNKCFKGVVPIENSIEGQVGLTLDLLAHKFNLKICGEIIIPINHNLLVNHNTKIEDITDVYSHSQALAQCQSYIDKKKFKAHFAVSTAKAAKSILGHENIAAIGNTKAAELYNLDIIDKNIQDLKNNQTRFVVLSKEDHQVTGRDKTSIIFSIFEDQPGELHKILGIFADNGINLTKIESRPSKEGLGKYIFFVDFYGHRNNDNIKNILKNIENNTSFLKVLGSYPEFYNF